MLNLEELERKLDNALANEDAKGLTDWLLNLRKDNYNTFLGVGCFEEIKAQSLNNSYIKVTPSSNIESNNYAGENNYSLAA